VDLPTVSGEKSIGKGNFINEKKKERQFKNSFAMVKQDTKIFNHCLYLSIPLFFSISNNTPLLLLFGFIIFFNNH
jgi:hypothetical protein